MANHRTNELPAYPYSETAATRMLASAIAKRQRHGRSLRRLAEDLGYKSATVLSHMQRGRLPIPIGNCRSIAETVGLDFRGFLLAALDQRFPTIDFQQLFSTEAGSEHRESNVPDEPIDFTALPTRVERRCRELRFTKWRDLVGWCMHPDLARRVRRSPNYGTKSQRDLERILRDRGLLPSAAKQD